MNTQLRHPILTPIVIFISLAAAYAILITAAGTVTNLLAQIVLVSTGSAILGSGLVFFMLRIITSQEKGK